MEFNIGREYYIELFLLPVVSGITYELIKWMGKSDSVFAKIIVISRT